MATADPVPPRVSAVQTVATGLTPKKVQRVGPAELAYLEGGRRGDGPTVFFLHGTPTHSFLWRKVLRLLGDDVHSIAYDLMGLGDTVVSPYEDFTAAMQAEILLDWLDKWSLDEVVLVGHEIGGAVAQQIVANHAERVRALCLIDSVCYDNWPHPLVAQAMRLARTPGLDTVAYALNLHRRIAHARIGFVRAVHDKACMPPDVVDEYLRPIDTVEGRERARRFLLAADNRFTMETVPGLRRFERPTAVLWGADDAFLSPSWGMRLADDIPGAAPMTLVPFCGHLVPEEAPTAVADAVRRIASA
jgi:pimeloyl-ACP methyl ester carboxylesterase